jgi:hypothetical protein
MMQRSRAVPPNLAGLSLSRVWWSSAVALAVCLSSLGLGPRAYAQSEPAERGDEPPGGAQPSNPGETPPRGPADIFRRSNQRKTPGPPAVPGEGPSRAKQGETGAPGTAAAPAPSNASPSGAPTGTPSGELPAGHPTVNDGSAAPAGGDAAGQAPAGDADGANAAPVGGDPHANSPDAPPLARKPIATAEPNSALPPGTIRVRVVDSTTEQPVGNAKLQLGTMSRDNNRNTQDATTSAAGEYRYEKLAGGDGQAYRINLLFDGAKYSTTPFRLPLEHGYDVLVRQLPTTRDPREVVLYVGATSIEVRDERLKIVQQARLINIGSKTFVFPEGGQLIKLPAGHKAFQTEDLMTDQHLKEEADQGFKISGSIAPGETTLTWGFDVPYDTTKVDLQFDLPWVTFAYRVLADAAPGMTLAVDDMPAPELHDDNGRHFWVSEVVKRVGDPPLRSLKIHVSGIPGPGPTRVIALVVALFVLGGGVWFARRQPPAATAGMGADGVPFEERKADLIAQAARLESERSRDEIGPEYYAQQLADLEERLASLLFEHSQKPASKSKAA